MHTLVEFPRAVRADHVASIHNSAAGDESFADRRVVRRRVKYCFHRTSRDIICSSTSERGAERSVGVCLI